MPKRRSTKAAVTALLASAALVGGSAIAASASTGYLAPGENADFATRGWGSTTICIYNNGPQYGHVVFSAWGSAAESDWIPPYDTYCKSAWWWGFNVNLSNEGTTGLYPYYA